MGGKVFIPVLDVPVNCIHRGFYRWVIAVVNDCLAIPLKTDSITFKNCAHAGKGAVLTTGKPSLPLSG